MRKRLLGIFALAGALALGASPLRADHGGKGRGHQHGANKFDDNDQGWERRDGFEYRTYGDRDERPPGWSRG